MKRIALRGLITALVLSVLMTACKPVEMVETPAEKLIHGTQYVLTFEDTFSGSKLNKNKWDYCPNYERGFLDPKGVWDDSMVSVEDGNLVLSVDRREDGVPISGAVRTRTKDSRKLLFSQCKGYFEARMKLQTAYGFWSAFWIMDTHNDDEHVGNGAADGAEIDIMEAFSTLRGGINHGIGWDGYGEYAKGTGQRVYNKDLYDGEYHTFALEWTDTEYIFYIDDEVSWRTSEPGMCEDPLYLKLTIECGDWDGLTGELVDSQLPAKVYVDYVRVWQRADLVSTESK